jgi:hypothetical protein
MDNRAIIGASASAREDLRERGKPSRLLPEVYAKSRQRRNDAEWHSLLFITDRGEEEVIQIRMEQRKSTGCVMSLLDSNNCIE